MKMIALDGAGMRSSALGFGCSGMLGRTGRAASLAALAGAYDAGITFYDTARSYGYGEAESLLGEFLHGRRNDVLISTKFGILPSGSSPLKRSAKPFARALLRVAPGARAWMQRRLAVEFSAGHFTVAALRESLDASLRALRTDYVDFLFLHEPPVGVLQHEDLFAALEQLVVAGKIRRFGVSSHPSVVVAALDAGIRTVQYPSTIFEPGLHGMPGGYGSDLIAIANHPFGGAQGVAESKALLLAIALSERTPTALAEKLGVVDDGVLADVVLQTITRDTDVHVVVPSMMRLDHLGANVAAIERSRFSSEELHWLRAAIGAMQTNPAL